MWVPPGSGDLDLRFGGPTLDGGGQIGVTYLFNQWPRDGQLMMKFQFVGCLYMDFIGSIGFDWIHPFWEHTYIYSLFVFSLFLVDSYKHKGNFKIFSQPKMPKIFGANPWIEKIRLIWWRRPKMHSKLTKHFFFFLLFLFFSFYLQAAAVHAPLVGLWHQHEWALVVGSCFQSSCLHN